MARVAVLLLLGLLPDERSLQLYERTRFKAAEPTDDAGRRVVELLLRKEHWVGAYRELADKYGAFPADLEVSVDFDFAGKELARAAGRGSRGTISFNLTQLSDAQKKIDAYQGKRKAAEARGQRMVFKVPPVKFDRVIYHELTHVLQQGYDAPLWFLEGMAQLAGDDPNSICAFAVEKKIVKDIDASITDRGDVYARGHLFWKWLETRHAVQKVFELCITQRRPWKESLLEATQQSWASLVASEREWSEKEVEKLR